MPPYAPLSNEVLGNSVQLWVQSFTDIEGVVLGGEFGEVEAGVGRLNRIEIVPRGTGTASQHGNT
jgi:hypothetical protein